ncbi:hypothetical protein EJB05_24528, partial [Eragrostis curvula]
MACKLALVASALMLAVVVFIASSDVGVEAWCISVPAPNTYVCRVKNGLQVCSAQCQEGGYQGGLCNTFDDCLCAACAEQGPPPHAL